MKLTVLTSDGEYVEYSIDYGYDTNDRGELDILDEQDVVVTTFNNNEWVRVYRDKEDDEVWPESVLPTRQKRAIPNEGVLGSDIDPSLGKQIGHQIKIPGMENGGPPIR